MESLTVRATRRLIAPFSKPACSVLSVDELTQPSASCFRKFNDLSEESCFAVMYHYSGFPSNRILGVQGKAKVLYEWK
jgi:hypothetical protein